MPVRIFLMAFSHVSASSLTEAGSNASKATPPAQSVVLWHSVQYWSRRLQ
jgi:hypothetical protein